MNSGFTLLEILIVFALVITLASFGLAMGFDSYQRYLFRSDVEKATTLLQQARNNAMNNLNQTSHGVYFGDSKSFIVFQGTSYASRNQALDTMIQKDSPLLVSGASEVIFFPLSGQTTPRVITLNTQSKKETITINDEGGIN